MILFFEPVSFSFHSHSFGVSAGVVGVVGVDDDVVVGVVGVVVAAPVVVVVVCLHFEVFSASDFLYVCIYS